MLRADEQYRFDAISMVACYGEEMHKYAKDEGCPHDGDYCGYGTSVQQPRRKGTGTVDFDD